MTRPKKRTKSRRAGIPCPGCGHAVSQVMRTTGRGDALQRVRQCEKCNRKFITRESTRTNDTELTALATDVAALFRARGIAPQSYLPHDPVR